MAFNQGLMKSIKHPDAARIKELGGPAALAKRLNFQEKGAVQRVQNWLTRGIPPAVKVQHPELFMNLPPAQGKRTKRVAVSAAG